jgi:hypothetical protein
METKMSHAYKIKAKKKCYFAINKRYSKLNINFKNDAYIKHINMSFKQKNMNLLAFNENRLAKIHIGVCCYFIN